MVRLETYSVRHSRDNRAILRERFQRPLALLGAINYLGRVADTTQRAPACAWTASNNDGPDNGL